MTRQQVIQTTVSSLLYAVFMGIVLIISLRMMETDWNDVVAILLAVLSGTLVAINGVKFVAGALALLRDEY